MFKRFAAVVAAGVLVATGLATGPAHAAPELTDTVRISGNYDNGNHGYWASLAYDRTVTIDRTGHNTWSVTLRDAGTFTTLRGAKSPEAGATLGAPVSGTFSGSYAYTVESERRPSDRFVRSAYNFRCNPAGSGDRTADCPSMPKSTSEWPALYFPQGAKVTPGAWRWEYRTCAERWVNAPAAAGGNSGDITGKRCDRAVRPDAPTVVQPDCGAERGKVVIPSERGVTYKVRADKHPWHVARAGEYPVRPGVYWVRAEAKDGYRLAGKALWRLTVREAEPCPTPTPTPTDEPPATPTEEPSEEPTETPSEEPSETPSEEPAKPAPTVTQTQTITRTVVVNNIPVPSRVDTGFGGLAR